MTKVPELTRQLKAAKLWPWIVPGSIEVKGDELYGYFASPHILTTLRARSGEFQECSDYQLHGDVGDHLTTFRGYSGTFGPGSLHVTIAQVALRFAVDLDEFNPDQDAVGFFGHAFVQ